MRENYLLVSPRPLSFQLSILTKLLSVGSLAAIDPREDTLLLLPQRQGLESLGELFVGDVGFLMDLLQQAANERMGEEKGEGRGEDGWEQLEILR